MIESVNEWIFVNVSDDSSINIQSCGTNDLLTYYVFIYRSILLKIGVADLLSTPVVVSLHHPPSQSLLIRPNMSGHRTF